MKDLDVRIQQLEKEVEDLRKHLAKLTKEPQGHLS